MPKGYWIAHVDVQDADAYKNYIEANTVPFKKYGASFLVRSGTYECVEGQTRSRNVVFGISELPGCQGLLSLRGVQGCESSKRGSGGSGYYDYRRRVSCQNCCNVLSKGPRIQPHEGGQVLGVCPKEKSPLTLGAQGLSLSSGRTVTKDNSFYGRNSSYGFPHTNRVRI